MSLNEDQRRAVERENQDVCVVAGPGSGKTRVLVERFAWLVDKGADPENIAAITFTEKAATELKKRLAERFAGRPDLRRKIERAQISTIHGFCLSVLREHAIAAGLDPRFQVLDELDAAALRHEAMQEALDATARERPEEFTRLAEVWPAARMDESLLNAYEAMRAAGKFEQAVAPLSNLDQLTSDLRGRLRQSLQSAATSINPNTAARQRKLEIIRGLLDDFEQLDIPELAARTGEIDLRGRGEEAFKACIREAREILDELKGICILLQFLPQRELLLDILRRFRDLFRNKKRLQGVLDFSDLEEYTLALLRSNQEIRRAVSSRFEHILMDELQDTNPLQWEILGLVRRPQRFFAVGDVNQSIYAFRHAEPELFRKYQDSVSREGEIDRISQNYRTRREILDAVSRILVTPPQPGIEPHDLKAANPFPDSGAPYVEILCADAGADPDADPALWLAARLREVYGTPLAEGRPARFEDMAVFVRQTSSFRDIERALLQFSIPYVVAGGRSFFDAQEIADLLNALRVLARPEDEIALFALLRSPFFGRSDEELLLRRLRRSLAAPEETELLSRLRSSLGAEPASLVLSRLISESGYSAMLSPAASANVEKFLAILDHLERRHGRDTAAILRQVEALGEASNEANAPAIEAGDAVRLMTIHKSKGLEFPIVAVAALEKGGGRDRSAARFHPDFGLGFRWRRGTDDADDWIMARAKSRLKEKENNESHRLLYVALTRAKERLILSFTKTRQPGPWVGLVLEGLGLDIPAEPGSQASTHLALLTRVAGKPEAAPAPDLHSPAPPPEIDPLPPPRQPPSEITVTALSGFAHCPRRYLLDSVLHWPLPPHRGGDAMALGTEVHEYLAGVRTEVSGEALALARVFEQSELGRRAARAQVRKQEMDFLVPADGILLRGQIDLWFDEGRGPVLVDYKTDRFLGEARLRGYELQVRLYAFALEQLTGKPVCEAWLFPLRESGPHRIEVSPEAIGSALELLRQWRAAEETGDFPTRESADCQWCPYASGPCPVIRPGSPGL